MQGLFVSASLAPSPRLLSPHVSQSSHRPEPSGMGIIRMLLQFGEMTTTLSKVWVAMNLMTERNMAVITTDLSVPRPSTSLHRKMLDFKLRCKRKVPKVQNPA